MKIKISILLLLISFTVNAQFIYNNGTSTAKVDTVRAKTGTAVLKGNFTLDGVINGIVSFPGFGTTGTTAATGNHNHTGVYQPAGSYLTSETDPLFNTSAAKNITTGNINAWNDKLSRSTTTVANPDSVWVVVDGTAQRAGVTSIPYGYYTNVNASGAVYTMTATSALIDFGNIDPVITVSQSGTWKIQVGLYVHYNAATFSSNQSINFKLRRTNNTASDIISTPAIGLNIVSNFTGGDFFILLPPVWYTTTNANDIIQLWGNLTALPSAGSITITGSWITAEKIYE